MSVVYRDSSSLDLIIRLQCDPLEKPSGQLVEDIQSDVIKFLVKEYVEKYGKDILGAIHTSEVAYKLTDDIADYLKQKLFKENQNEPS